MKKTVWQPLVLGIVLGSLAGISIITGLTFLTSGLATNAIGFYVTLLLLSAALGGPLAGIVASVSMIISSALFGSPEMKAIITIPSIFWSNVLLLGMIETLVGFGYRFIYERVKMPARLLPWAGIVIVYYLLNSGWRATFRIMPNWSIFPDLNLSGQYEYNRVKFPERGQELNAHLFMLRLLATLSTKFSILTFVQYNGADDLAMRERPAALQPARGKRPLPGLQ